ncbi:MAG: sulfatase-like hydrolase/transferase [Bacteroidota bacterium]
MKKNNLLLGILLMMMFCGISQNDESGKLVLITLDGLRWQELFSGADAKLISNKEYVHDTVKLKEKFWRDSEAERRKALMPFFWSEVSRIGRLHGNRDLGSKVDLTNRMWFSYPGYNEILTGRVDNKRINSNKKINNPNTTILEIANKDNNYSGKVAAFGSWDVFPFIVNESRSGVPVNAGFESADGPELSEREVFLNELQQQIPSPWGTVRLDAFTHHYAMEYMKQHHPKVLYVAYGETDDFAHDGNYEAYLNSANTTDKFIEELWNYVQTDPFYKGQTTFIVTTDHGRGTEPLGNWRHHGIRIKGAGEVWLVAFGKQISPAGELGIEEQLYSTQIAPTVLNLLGLSPENQNKLAKPLPLRKP